MVAGFDTHADEIAPGGTRAAHLVLVPCRPADVTASGPSIDLARHAGTPTFVVLNDVPIQHRAGVTTVPQARKARAALGVDCSPIVMYHRTNHVKARASGLTAQERNPKRPAAREIDSLFAWVEGVQLIKTNHQTDRAQDDDAQSPPHEAKRNARRDAWSCPAALAAARVLTASMALVNSTEYPR